MTAMKKESTELTESIVPDTSVIVEGLLSRMIESGEMKTEKILLHEAVFAELEHQANSNRTMGFLGLDEISRLQQLAKQHDFTIEVVGKRPGFNEIRMAAVGEIDSIIRDYAYEVGATLVTADKVQAKVAQTKGVQPIFLEIPKKKQIKLETFFDETTMSVHLREGVVANAKKGVPGNWAFVPVGKAPLTRDEVRDIAREIIEATGSRKDGFIEIEREGSTIVQLGSYRIVNTRPPLSDGWEITAVRPVKRMSMSDYEMSEKLKTRIETQAEGMLIAGAPGHGKSTFAQALAEFYLSMNKVIKTIEAPRDLVLPDAITQYAISHADSQEIHDILLLSRPDYTIFDEMRNTNDFKLFTDLRLAGIGLVGVVHATNPVDAIQRFVGRIELGVIPQVIDTVIFIKNGQVGKVLSLQMVVKVPAGMTEADLARPVVVVTDFETNRAEYELYSYGEETVVVPVRDQEHASASHKLAASAVENYFRRFSNNAKAEFVSDSKVIVYLPEDVIAQVIGKGGKNITEIEQELGLSIDIKELDSRAGSNRAESSRTGSKADAKTDVKSSGKDVGFATNISKKFVEIYPDAENGATINIFADGDYLMTTKVGKKGSIKIRKQHKMGKIIGDAISSKILKLNMQ